MNKQTQKHTNSKSERPDDKTDGQSTEKERKPMMSRTSVQAYTMVIFSLFALAFFAIFAIKPTLNSFFQLRKQIEDAKKLDSELTVKIRSLLRAQDEYYRYQNDLSLIEDALPKEPEFPALLSKIETVTTEENTPIISFTTKDIELLDNKELKTQVDDGITNMFFTLEVVADYARNKALLKRLSNLRRIILFDRLALTMNKSDNAENVKLEISAKAFHLEKPVN